MAENSVYLFYINSALFSHNNIKMSFTERSVNNDRVLICVTVLFFFYDCSAVSRSVLRFFFYN